MNSEEDVFSFNFWPSFADLMLSVVLILIIVIFVIYSVLSAGSVNLRHVQNRQRTFIEELAGLYGTKAVPDDTEEEVYSISIRGGASRDVIIRNEPTLQRFSFGSHILFAPDSVTLTENGRQVLRKLGVVLKKQLPLMKEIQIQGHADPVPTRRYRSNLDLAAFRAMEVYRFFQDSVGIDPAQHLMSATSFGAFKPVQRTENDSTYNQQRLEADNQNFRMKDRNRRIELIIFNRF